MAAVRFLAIENLQNDLNNFSLSNTTFRIKIIEKNEKVLQLLKDLKF
jgi:glutaminyl-tRNA synthetase